MNRVIHAPRLVKYMTFNFARAITLYPFIFLRYGQDRKDNRLLNHEQIHLKQQLELLVLPFYIWYLLEYALGRLKGRSHYEAYLNISFEREAFIHESDFYYLQHRKPFAFRKYQG